MKKKIIKLLSLLSLTIVFISKIDNLQAVVPFYFLPSTKNLKKDGLSLGNTAYQLLYFGQIKDSLSLAKLAVKMDKSNEKLWTILAETQIANNLLNEAIFSLNKAQKINPNLVELYFAKSNIFLKQSNTKKAKIALNKGLQIQPKNHNAIFQLGNIFLMEKNYIQAIKEFEKAITIKPDFWQAINNQGLAYFEMDKINQSIIFFKKTIEIEEFAEPLLGLAACLRNTNLNEAILLARKALIKDPNYVDLSYREEQLWGLKLQDETEKLLKDSQLKKEIIIAKSKINKTY